MRVVHYTKEASFELRPITIKNAGTKGIWCKPQGGLWASPVDSEFGWPDWCRVENFGDTAKQLRVILDIDMGSFITIDSQDDLSQLPWHPSVAGFNLMEAIDFEKLVAGGVDGIYLTEQGQWATRFSFPRTLYGWDCESILILNERCIKHYRIVKETEEMAEGYQAMAAENRRLAEESLPVALEEWPDWEETADPYTCPKRRKDSEG